MANSFSSSLRSLQRQVIITGHSYGASTAILAAYDISVTCDLRPKDIVVYTYGCPAQGNLAAKIETEIRLPYLFNVVNGSDVIYYSGKNLGLFKHPGITVNINADGDLIYRPSFVEASLSHFSFQDSVIDHTFSSYQKSIAAIIRKHPVARTEIHNIVRFCPTICQYLDPENRPFNTQEIPMSQGFKLNDDYSGHGLCSHCGVKYESLKHIGDEIKKDVDFMSADLDGDGKLDKEEIKVLFEREGMAFTDSEVDLLFEKFDIDGSGDLDEDEFERLMKEKRRGHAALKHKKKSRTSVSRKKKGKDMV